MILTDICAAVFPPKECHLLEDDVIQKWLLLVKTNEKDQNKSAIEDTWKLIISWIIIAKKTCLVWHLT